MAEIAIDMYLAYENGYEAGKKDATQKWISVKERLPLEMEDKTPLSGWSREIRPSDDVLIWLTIEKRQTVAWYSHAQDCWTTVDEKTDYLPREVSHWMPLPEPPKEGGAEDNDNQG